MVFVFLKKDKRGVNFLMGNILFIILNVTFLMILALFVYSKSSSLSFYEEIYAKKIALSLDYAKPNMIIELDLKEVFNKAQKKLGEEGVQNAINIQGNQVTVRFSKGTKGYSYPFFNDISIDSSYWHIDKDGVYVIVTGDYNEE
ncbi:MAG TPA: hypothetical protein PLK34_00430 [Candidatus Pacearchaeota archaeon]|nr:hypothetical protein [Candidatus Pacearchaeota archaeon]